MRDKEIYPVKKSLVCCCVDVWNAMSPEPHLTLARQGLGSRAAIPHVTIGNSAPD